jgi:tetratricopeptide (TPR) repeat protein
MENKMHSFDRSARVIAAALGITVALVLPAAADDMSDCRSPGKAADTMLAACSRVIEAGTLKDSELATAHMGRGLALRRQGEFERAIVEYNEAIRLAPERPDGYQGRASVFVDLGQREHAVADWDAAIAWYDRMIVNSPDNAYAYLGRAGLYRDKGELDRAIADYGEGIRIRPADLLSYMWRARTYLLKGDVAKALADATQVTSQPNWAAAGHTVRGMVYQMAGRLDEALTDHEAAIKLNPTSGWTYANRGRVREAKGEREQALADFATAKQNDPAVVWVYVLYGNALEMSGRADRALGEYEFALKLDPKALAAAKGRDRVRAALAAAGSQTAAGPPPTPHVAAAPAPAPSPPPAAIPVPAAPPPVVQAAEPRVAVAPPPPVPAQPAKPTVPTPAAETGRRVALVIGNASYRHATALPNPGNDAADMAQALRELGFEVIEGRDLDWAGIHAKVREFARKLDDATMALFFYAGHGVQVDGRNYLVPVDAKLDRAGTLDQDAVDLLAVLRPMETEKRVNLVFLDACRDNPFTGSLARSLGASRSTAVGRGLAPIQRASGTLITYATEPGITAADGEGRNSPFTAALLRHIRKPGIEIEQMMKLVRLDVMQATREKQLPKTDSGLLSEVFLKRAAQ